MSDTKKTKQKTGLPLFDKDTEMRIAKEALDSGNVAAYCRERNLVVDTVRRYIKKFEKRQRAEAPSAPRDTGSFRPAAGAQYRRAQPKPDHDRIRQLEEELREAYATIGRMKIETDKIKGRN